LVVGHGGGRSACDGDGYGEGPALSDGGGERGDGEEERATALSASHVGEREEAGPTVGARSSPKTGDGRGRGGGEGGGGGGGGRGGPGDEGHGRERLVRRIQ
jgi:hypothetical protein